MPRGEERRVAQVRNIGREARLRSWRAEASVGTGRPTSLPAPCGPPCCKLPGRGGRLNKTDPLGAVEMPSQEGTERTLSPSVLTSCRCSLSPGRYLCCAPGTQHGAWHHGQLVRIS